ncbi:hypothetical protein ACX2JU_004149 [Klebsiella variicola]|uniref:hypothetical protein n=1 Tax=Klebsiella TaxID=570 RepID=UPI000E3C5488|nr:hypothetical protein [Klebsiella variicola]HCQ9097420.1 hypothetical protein [Klebsiella variicola]
MPDILLGLLVLVVLVVLGIASIFSESKGKPKARAKAPERERLKQRQGNRTPRPTIQPAEHNRRFLEEQRERNAEYTKKLIEQTEADIKASEKFFLED